MIECLFGNQLFCNQKTIHQSIAIKNISTQTGNRETKDIWNRPHDMAYFMVEIQNHCYNFLNNGIEHDSNEKKLSKLYFIEFICNNKSFLNHSINYLKNSINPDSLQILCYKIIYV